MSSMIQSTFIKKSLITSCILLASLASTSSLAKDQVTFQLDWLPGGDKAPVFVGIEQGFFADAGIEVRVSSGRGSADSISKIATNNADIGLSDLVSLLMAKAENKVPVSAVYSIFTEAPHAFYVDATSGINDIADVAGKRIATSPFTSSNLFLPLLLELNGLSEDDITLVKADPGALNPMLMTGNTDVVISWVTDSVKYQNQAKEANKSINIMPWYDAGLAFYSTSIIASDRFLNEKPDVAKRFIDAYAKAIEYTWNNPEESGKMVQKQVPEVNARDAADTIRAIHGLVYNEASQTHGMGVFDPERLKTTWSWTAKAQNIEASIFDPETAINRFYFDQ